MFSYFDRVIYDLTPRLIVNIFCRTQKKTLAECW